jgi:hypothetical protein
MNEALSRETLAVSKEKRVLNEFEAKVLNEETIDKVVESRRVNHSADSSEILIYCECDDQACAETISISIEEYQQVHSKTKNFIVSRSHVNFDLEEIISSFPQYILVAKAFPSSRVAKE